MLVLPWEISPPFSLTSWKNWSPSETSVHVQHLARKIDSYENLYKRKENHASPDGKRQKGRGSTLTTFDAEGTLERLKQWCGEETCDRLLKNSVPNSGLEIDVVYTADINEFRGERNPQFKIVDMRLSQ